ncbi:MAG: hypothetical protein NTW08_05935 [Gammaproteobacteria bacterium]|nr:hypothetical protein [Gammaproteobacteria bacterium]
MKWIVCSALALFSFTALAMPIDDDMPDDVSLYNRQLCILQYRVDCGYLICSASTSSDCPEHCHEIAKIECAKPIKPDIQDLGS